MLGSRRERKDGEKCGDIVLVSNVFGRIGKFYFGLNSLDWVVFGFCLVCRCC